MNPCVQVLMYKKTYGSCLQLVSTEVEVYKLAFLVLNYRCKLRIVFYHPVGWTNCIHRHHIQAEIRNAKVSVNMYFKIK